MINKAAFGFTKSGKPVDAYTIGDGGISVTVITYGGALQAIRVKDKVGTIRDVALGYDDVEGYEKNGGYIGALIGRFGNRIDKAKFKLNGTEYQLFPNDGENHLHGGKVGYNARVWKARVNGESLMLNLVSEDGEEGYPGKLDIQVTYTVKGNALHIVYDAVCDADTILNLTNHCYFNLNGHDSGDVLSQELQINASEYTPIDSGSIPLGSFENVQGTPFDFRAPKSIGRDILTDNVQLSNGSGYDHNFKIDGRRGEMKEGAVARGNLSNITMRCNTTEQCVQLYSGNFLSNVQGKNGAVYNKRNAFCLETQEAPDCINQPALGNPILKKGEHYHTETIYSFSVDE